jgi:hypothetical protein
MIIMKPVLLGEFDSKLWLHVDDLVEIVNTDLPTLWILQEK